MKSAKNPILLIDNIYNRLKTSRGLEIFETIIQSGNDFKIEKIVSNGASSPENFWYDQETDEFILLIQGKAKILFEKGDTVVLKTGDYIIIPKNIKHRISYTSSKPKCIWLCVFGIFNNKNKVTGVLK